jgi:hypothetical protein
MIYLASPYSHPDTEVMELRFRQTREYVAHLMFNKGKAVFSPILYAHELSQDFDGPTDFSSWKFLNDVMLRRADEMYVLAIDGWEQSAGVQHELLQAQTMGLPYRFVSANGMMLL